MRIIKIIAGLVLIITGVLCFAYPGATFIYIAFLLGCAMLFSGVSGILVYIVINLKKESSGLILAEGLLSIILGTLVLLNQLATDAVVPLVFGMWVMFSGILRVVVSLEMKHAGIHIWKWILAQGMISILAGTYAFVNTILLGVSVLLIVGIFFVIQGVNILTTGINMPLFKRKKEIKHRSRLNKEQDQPNLQLDSEAVKISE